jgi:predicted Zn finger-like uncharacterized protein
MAIEALCPTCGAVFNLKDEYQGKKVRCKKCEQTFTVGGEAKAKARDEDDGVQAKAGTVPAKKGGRDDDEDEERSSRKGRAAAKRGRDDDDDDERPRRSSSRRGRDDDDDDDDDDDRGGKRKRTYHGDDDDDDDRAPRRVPKKSSGGTGMVLAIVGGIIAVVVLVCGGISYGIYRAVQAADEAIDDAAQQANNGQPPFGFDPGGGWIGAEKQPKDVGEALTFLKGNDVGEKRGAANWLAKQPVDPGRQKEVAQALEPLVNDRDDGTCACGARGMRTWGSKDNGPALTTALKQRSEQGIPGDCPKELMAAIGHLKYGAGADEILRFLPSPFVGGDAERALDELGSGAEKSVVKYYNDPNDGVRDKARRLVQRYGTKPAVILDQTETDLRAVDQNRAKAAVDWLTKPSSDAALAIAKAEPARRKAVATALNPMIEAPPAFFEDTVLAAAKRWGTADNVAALIHFLTTNPFKRRQTSDVLIAIGPACVPEVKPLLSDADGGIVNEAKYILSKVGGADSKIEVFLADLKSKNNQRIAEAAKALQRMPVDDKQRAAVAVALLDAIDGDAFFQGNDTVEAIARAVAVWGTKDDGAAVVEKVTPLKKPFLNNARRVFIEWLGSKKVDKGIPFLAGLLTDRDEYQTASKALQAMGPDLGEAIELQVTAVNTNDPNQLVECFKVLGAVGTKKSVPLLKSQQKAFEKKNATLATAAGQAILAIEARGK